jgi:hypothetical protein
MGSLCPLARAKSRYAKAILSQSFHIRFFGLLVVFATDCCVIPRYGELPAIVSSGADVPQYFFNVLHDSSGFDIEGSELPDIYAAKVAAVRLCWEMIREIDGKFWEEPLWRLEVTNHQKRPLFTLTFSADEHGPAS